MPDRPTTRVVITGLGVISPLGNSKEELWDALSTRRSGVDTLQSIPYEHLPTSIGGEARNFTGHIDRPHETARRATMNSSDFSIWTTPTVKVHASVKVIA